METIAYPPPSKGPDRLIWQALQEGELLPEDADRLLTMGIPWWKVAMHVQDWNWWRTQPLNLAPPIDIPWEIETWDATVQLKCGDLNLWIDPGLEAPIPTLSPDAIVITHAHYDHTAALECFCEQFPYASVIMTHETAKLLNLRQSYINSLSRARLTDYCETVWIAGSQINLLPAGHLLGAAMVEVQSSGANFLISSDFALREVGGLPGAQLPDRAYQVVLLENNTASRRSLPFADPSISRQFLLKDIARHLQLQNNKAQLVCQAFGQAQEVYASLILAQRAGAFPDLTIRFRGLAAEAAWEFERAFRSASPVWKTPVLIQIADALMEDTLIITSESRNESDANLESPFVFRPTSIHTHSSWGERLAIGLGLRCDRIFLYHGKESSLLTDFRSLGRHVEYTPTPLPQ